MARECRNVETFPETAGQKLIHFEGLQFSYLLFTTFVTFIAFKSARKSFYDSVSILQLSSQLKSRKVIFCLKSCKLL